MYYRGHSFIGIRKVELDRTSASQQEAITLEDTFDSCVDDVTDKMSVDSAAPKSEL